ncbi:MAG: GNAT family N-acetyltransferase [Propionibacteriaceae bacterium]|nr:GNAT family N-acetyltransferase [Propionibacteriaceae bacterium]
MIEITEVPLPEEATHPGWVAYARMSARSSEEALGPSGTVITPAELLAKARPGEQCGNLLVRRWLAHLDGEPVGFARLVVDRIDDPTGGTVLVHVEPEHRGRGFGKALARTLREAIPATADHLGAEVMSSVPAEGEGTVPAVSGGAVAADHPGVRLALDNGFALAQALWFQRLELAAAASRWEPLMAKARAVAGEGYEVRTFEGVPPEELRPGIAVLKQRMSTDAPRGEVILPETRWDADRVADRYESMGLTVRVLLAVVVHRPTGEVVALNELMSARLRPDAPLHQQDTLVLPSHRGRRLGLLVKAANLMAAHAAVPEATAVFTFNAHENQHMLAINDELGFERRGVLGLFQTVRGGDG